MVVVVEKVICPHNSPLINKRRWGHWHWPQINKTTVYHILPIQWDLGDRKSSCMQCDQKKATNVYKSCPKMISLEKLILTPLQKLPKNVGDLV